MTHEERFEQIDERLGAIAMHLEITSSMQQSNEKAILTLTAKVDLLADKVEILTDKVGILTERTIQAMDAIGRLANIAGAHEQRIEGLENRKQ